MATITLKGNEIHTNGELPAVGTQAPQFTLVDTKLGDVSSNFGDKVAVINVFPSVDTGVCAASVRAFNEQVAELENVVIVNVSKDLPFALGRFCGAEGIENAISLSAFRSDWGDEMGVTMVDGPLAGLLARAVVVVGSDGVVRYVELVPEIAQEPDYAAAFEAAKSA